MLPAPGQKKGTVWVQDTVRSNQLPSLAPLYNSERAAYLGREGRPEGVVPDSDHTFDIRLETEARQVGRMVAAYLAEKRGPTILAVQSPLLTAQLQVCLLPAASVPPYQLPSYLLSPVP